MQRSERRERVRLDGRIDTGAWQAAVSVRDISAGGALIEGGRVPGKGTELRLVCRGWVRAGRVTWGTDHRCGIMFLQPLDAATLALMVPEATPLARRA